MAGPFGVPARRERKEPEMERVSVAQAAKELEMTPLTVRVMMQQKQIDLGYVMTGANGCHTYIILRSLLNKELERIKG